MADIAALVTVHAETAMAAPTFASADAAIARAEQAGFTVERRIGFDNPAPGVLDYFSQPVFDGWDREVFDFRDQGATRNALARSSRARFLAFLDADDLWSENWLARAAELLACAEAAGERVIAHPEVNWFFEGHNTCLFKLPQEDPFFLPEYFLFTNCYDALCMAPREAHLKFPYAPRDLKAGYAIEDWQWSVETMDDGWIHRYVPDTLIFKRKQRQSQSANAVRASAVIRNHDPLRLDRVGSLHRRWRTGNQA